MIKIGCKYKDLLTGFEGIAIGTVVYITGCNQALIQPRGAPDKRPESEWVDEQRLEQVGEEMVELPEVEAAPPAAGGSSVRGIKVTTGGDREPPKR